jgi:hypothetical protein
VAATPFAGRRFPEPGWDPGRQPGNATDPDPADGVLSPGRDTRGEPTVSRPALRIVRPAALLLAAIALSACVGTAGAVVPSTTPSASPTSVDPDRPVFSVTWEGGFVAPGTILGQLPVIVVHADGRVITQGPQVAIYPGPLMPNLLERTLSADTLARLIDLAHDEDLLRNAHYDFPGIADATDTVLTIELGGTTYRVSAYALAEAGVEMAPGIPLDEATTKGRAQLRAFIDVLTGLPSTDFVDAEHTYLPTAIRIYSRTADVVPNSELPGEQPAIAWPLGDLATAGEAVANHEGVRCQLVEGADLATVMPALDRASQLSTFRSGDELYALIPRPLLPGETGC